MVISIIIIFVACNLLFKKRKKQVDINTQDEHLKEKKQDFGKLDAKSIKKLEGVHSKVVKFAVELSKLSERPMIITQGVRTAEYQNSLYQQGRTKPGKKVTNCDGYIKKSNHQAKDDGYGYAVDIGFTKLDNPKALDWTPELFINLANKPEARDLMKKYNVGWGGDWKTFKDYPHFELKK